ncbi:GntR family transcriptional regulator [Sphingobium yanoikuyae]|jgi:DNA-binding GntR family transcriptional regulator|uniref:GntR family transcriptional regulator n=1 Tax=Sphingobium yanoikuyae TaxID=13690 RepID=A0A430BKQ8_SPHYA|nr:GntR family transcriptional regulator [Sphingobium yanoikuyae]RSU52234.1 GntR family transcriptional regulator [Sphingobium yanoikuyae]
MRKKDQVRDQILNRLLSAHYRFGDPIPVKELCEETGISRQPIMTALAELSTEGFVTVVAQVGCEVASPSREEIDDFYLMFERLEGLMAELAARRRTPEQVRRLKAINLQISLIEPSDVDAAEDYRSLNRAFHALMHEMAQSPLLLERQSNIFTMSDFFIAQTIGFIPHLKGAAEEHEEIIEAIASQDSECARYATERHIHEVGNFVREGFSQSA